MKKLYKVEVLKNGNPYDTTKIPMTDEQVNEFIHQCKTIADVINYQRKRIADELYQHEVEISILHGTEDDEQCIVPVYREPRIDTYKFITTRYDNQKN